MTMSFSDGVGATETTEAIQTEAPAVSSEAVEDSAPTETAAQKSWRESLPEDLRALSTIQNIPSIETLVKNYDHAQRALGAPKIALPTKHATDDDWNRIFDKLGRPESPDKYELKIDGEFDEQILSGFKEISHKTGILPKQAQQVLDWFNETQGAKIAEHQQSQERELASRQQELKQKWGQAFEKNLSVADSAVAELLSDEQFEYLNQRGLTKDPAIAEIFYEIAQKALGEDKLRGSEEKRQGFGVMTPEEAKRKIGEIRGNAEHPYNVQGHPNRAAAAKELQSLYEMAYGTEPAAG
jgi:hypothetical protein